MTDGILYRLSAFPDGKKGGNPAGVWAGDTLPEPPTMQAIAKEVGFSETAFVAPQTGGDYLIRFYSPEAEVSFCGHATIATGVVLGRKVGEGRYRLATTVGEVPVTVRRSDNGFEASLTSVEPRHMVAPDELLDGALRTLAWTRDDLEDSIPPANAYAGAWHLVLAVRRARRLDQLDYDFEALKALMMRHRLTTLQLVWRERKDLFRSRNPFPVGGVVEDPATGASAAALGGYLRNAGLIAPPFRFTIRQGEAMDRPSVLTIEVPRSGGIVVTGSAIDL